MLQNILSTLPFLYYCMLILSTPFSDKIIRQNDLSVARWFAAQKTIIDFRVPFLLNGLKKITIDETFYICLENPFEFIWNLKSSFEIWKFGLDLKFFLFRLKIYFKHGPREVVPCVCIKPCHMINLNSCTWHHSAESTFEINFQRG